MTHKVMFNNWEYAVGTGGLLATLSVAEYNKYAAAVIATITILILLPRMFVWWIKAYQTWRDFRRNKTVNIKDNE